MSGRSSLAFAETGGAAIALVVGTRPEAIKLAPVYRALEDRGARPLIVLTGQHDELLDPMIRHFGLERRVSLHARDDGDSIGDFAGRCLQRCGELFAQGDVDAVIVQGDTTSAMAGALAAAFAQLPVGHVESGLRTGDLDSPFPEELNRQMIARTARWHFAPTDGAAANLHREAVLGAIHVVGNTVVDAALWTAGQAGAADALARAFPDLQARQHVLVTAHRRESFGPPMRAIARSVAELSDRHPDIHFVVPLHPNPAAGVPMRDALEGRANVLLTGPLPYPLTIALVARALAILTDSGGLQEEAPSFGVPLLVLRDTTERPEGVSAGFSRLVGTDSTAIVSAFGALVKSPCRPTESNPYGDGYAGTRIASVVIDALAARARAC